MVSQCHLIPGPCVAALCYSSVSENAALAMHTCTSVVVHSSLSVVLCFVTWKRSIFKKSEATTHNKMKVTVFISAS